MYLFINVFFFFCLNRADEVKEHPFFLGVDWQQVYMQKYPPPLIPPRGEVNAADAFDIGSFDEEDTKGYKVHYRFFFPPVSHPSRLRPSSPIPFFLFFYACILYF